VAVYCTDQSGDDTSTPTRRQRQSSTSVYPPLYPSPPVSPEDTEPFMYHASAAAVRGRSVSKDEPAKDVSKIKEKFIRHGSLPAAKRFFHRFCLLSLSCMYVTVQHVVIIIVTTEWAKKTWHFTYLRQLLFDFQNSFTGTLCRQFTLM